MLQGMAIGARAQMVLITAYGENFALFRMLCLDSLGGLLVTKWSAHSFYGYLEPSFIT